MKEKKKMKEFTKKSAVALGIFAVYFWLMAVTSIINTYSLAGLVCAGVAGSFTVGCLQFAYDYFKGFEVEVYRG